MIFCLTSINLEKNWALQVKYDLIIMYIIATDMYIINYFGHAFVCKSWENGMFHTKFELNWTIAIKMRNMGREGWGTGFEIDIFIANICPVKEAEWPTKTLYPKQ